MVRSTKTTRGIQRLVSNATILATFVSIANGTSARYAKSTTWDIRNTVAPSTTVPLVLHPLPRYLHPLDLTLFPLLVLTV